MSLRRLCPAVPTCLRMMPSSWAVLCIALLCCCIAAPVTAQSTNATINGQITDAQGRVVPDTEVDAVNIGTNVAYPAKTNKAGIYSIPTLPPGPYRIHVRRDGFKEINMTGVVLHTQDTLEQNFSLEVGSVSESVTVNGSGLNINTTDATVSTVVDRQFVDNMPLNGRSFQSLILLAPGTVTNPPQLPVSQGSTGEYSVNGQRADANSFMVDGVSANNSPYPSGPAAQGSAGSLPATSALGTTQGLVSVDALQEFKIQTSTYSAEYGRQPGAQISFETRSGTNSWHGSAFDYLRNDIFDANNWFNDDTTPATRKPAERQNDFGGTIGGPLVIPRIYSGKDRTFYFLSYEGLRLTQPQPASVYYVPSAAVRSGSAAALQPLMNAFPLPNCAVTMSPLCVDPGNGLLPFLFSASLPSSLDSFSARFDQQLRPWLRVFARYSSMDSSQQQSASTYTSYRDTNTKTFTVGADSPVSSSNANEFRFNYSPASASARYETPTYDGAVPTNLLSLNGIQSSVGFIETGLSFPGYSSYLVGGGSEGKQSQWNVIDTIAWGHGNHFFHFGFDYRRTNVTAQATSPEFVYIFGSVASTSNNSPSVFFASSTKQYPEFTNFSAFVQDDWRATRRVNLSLGLRWELNPPPSVTSGPDSRTVDGNFNNPASLTLAPAGTPLYHTTYYNFAPRLGMAAILHDTPGQELVLRAGGGVFFDTGQSLYDLFGAGYSPGLGFSKSYAAGPTNAFPFTAPLSIPIGSTLVPPYSTIYLTSQHLQLPYAFQWNATVEQSIGSKQSVSLGYVGSNSRRLLRDHPYSISGVNPLFSTIFRFENGLSSSYNSLQLQYKRTLSSGLQALGSYTWSHALDYQSRDSGFFPYQRGNSDFDVRHSFSVAVSYDLLIPGGSAVARALLQGWGADLRATARTSFPVTLNGNALVDPSTGSQTYSGLDVIPGVPLYLYKASYPGGRSVNPAAFKLPSGTEVGNAPRNFVRGFGENEVNFALRRDFPIHERLHLQFRAEAFNVFNRPNFGYVNPNYGNALFGQATQTLASSIGGLTSLYQQGGPRSLQFSLRLQF